MPHGRALLIGLAALSLVGCSLDTSATPPRGPDSPADASTGDAGGAGPPDSRPIVRMDDSGMTGDANIDGAVDSGTATDAAADSRMADTSVMDSAVPDSAVLDSAVPDSAVLDSAVPDSAVLDSAVPDSAVPDAGTDAGPLAPCRDRPDECVGLFGGFCDATSSCDEGVCCMGRSCGAAGTCTQTCEGIGECPIGMGCAHGFCFFTCSSSADCFSTMTCAHRNTICEW
ncbi:MAG: hypothetical protein JRH11_21910 [Deltaproteobacteria bacterium]|nr:hypothetical protein [Deltaproteobacteria bacterium]